MRRLHAIDILRALAIIWMVQIHFVDNLGYLAQRDTPLYAVFVWFGFIPAPLFTFLAGASLFLSLRKHPPEAARARVLQRGVILFGVGLVHNLINWGWDALFDWDILTLIGSALIIVYLLRRLNWLGIAALIGGILVISPILRELTGYNLHWNFLLDEYTYALTLRDLFLGWLLQGTFPLLPWVAFPLAGYAAGRALLGESATPRRCCSPAGAVIGTGISALGLGLLGILVSRYYGESLSAPWNGYFTPVMFYPASTTYLLVALGGALIAFAALWLLLDADQHSRARFHWERAPLFPVVQRYSRYSLSVYVIHHSIHLWPVYLAGWLYMGDRWYFYENAMPIWAALAFWGIFVLAFGYVSALWDRIQGRYSLEWMLARLLRG